MGKGDPVVGTRASPAPSPAVTGGMVSVKRRAHNGKHPASRSGRVEDLKKGK